MRAEMSRAVLWDALFDLGVRACSALVLLGLLWVLWQVGSQGMPSLSLNYLLEAPARAGRSGGVAPILVSTLLVLGIAMVIAVPLALAVAIWLTEYSAKHVAHAGRVRLALDALAGVPSIVFGLFGSAFFSILLGLGFSLLAGGLTLACMILPILIRSAEFGLSALPQSWRMDAAALGLSRWTLVHQVLLPAAAAPLAAGLMLGAGRALAESAALIFTSGYVDRMPGSLLDSGRTLAVHVYDLAMNVAGGDRAAYAAAALLAVLVVLINLATSLLQHRWGRLSASTP